MLDKRKVAAARKLLGDRRYRDDWEYWEDIEVEASEQPLDFCCGVRIIGNFGHVKFSEREKAIFILSLAEDINEKMVIATTVSKQRAAIALLRYAGFVPVQRSAGSEGPITLWSLVLRSPGSR
jgi:hypothetical protein